MMDRDTFYEQDGDGNIIQVDCLTGAIVDTSKDVKVKHAFEFHPAYGDIICQKIATGMTLTKITALAGMPNIGVISRWRSENESFDDALKIAESARAERFHDRMVDSLEQGEDLDKDQVPAAKLQFEKLKYLAKVNNRGKFGERDAKDDSKTGDITIVLNTGINRSEESIPADVISVVEKQIKEI